MSFGVRKMRWFASALAAVLVVAVVVIDESPATAATSGIWSGGSTPVTAAETEDGLKVEVGLKFQVAKEGYVHGVTFYKGTTNTGRHVGSLWSSKGKRLARAKFTNETASGWQTVSFRKPVHVKPNRTYTASYLAPRGNYAVDESVLQQPVTNGFITALKDGGVYRYGGGFPTSVWKSSNYWVDVLYRPSSGASPSTSVIPQPVPTSTTLEATTTTSTVVPTTTTAKPTTTSKVPTPTSVSSGGWPGANNTGVAGCPPLEKVNNGDTVVLNKDNVVYENKELMNDGVIIVSGKNVTVRCVKMNGTGWYGIDNTERPDGSGNYRELLVEKVDITCKDSGRGIPLLVRSATVRAVNVHNCNDGVMIGGDNVIIENSYCHDLTIDPKLHGDCIQSQGGNSNLIIRGNALYGWDTSDVLLGQEYGDSKNVVIDGNRFLSNPKAVPPAYLLYLSGTNTIVSNNRFSHRYTYGHCTLNTKPSNVTWTNNVWDEDGKPISSC